MLLGLGTLAMARIHEQALVELVPADCSARLLGGIRRRASRFFLDVLAPIEAGYLRLKQEIAQRQAAESALIESEQHHRLLLQHSWAMERRLRQLSHQLLSVQEEERKKISRELHDQIAQMLAGINVHLASLKGAVAITTANLNRKITTTQRLVEKSVNTVHRFARALRPPVLDDLGLIPAFQADLKTFTERTGILARCTIHAAVELLHPDKRTVLYRVAQEALANVGRHAKASQVTIAVEKVAGSVVMRIHDNGRSFEVERVLFAKTNRRLGLIGMRERVEMVGGTFSLRSAPGEGTTIVVQIPFQPAGNPSQS